jgi:hypothetical protein
MTKYIKVNIGHVNKMFSETNYSVRQRHFSRSVQKGEGEKFY